MSSMHMQLVVAASQVLEVMPDGSMLSPHLEHSMTMSWLLL